MVNVWPLFLVLINCWACRGEDQRGIVHVYGSSRIKVQLECASKFMNVNLFINGTTPFFDWIVVGKTNRAECRQQGNGDLQYLIEIPLLNDPCGTRMIETSSTFENVISIKRMPLLILEGDETISVQCVYGPPEIGTPIIPTLPQSQNVQQSVLSTSKTDLPTDDSPNVNEPTKVAGVLPAHVYLIIFMVLFLTLLCLCCGCLYFFFKRRKLRVERRKKLLLAVPANSEMGKLGLRHLWWSGKHSGISGTVSNDALLSHDYMVSTTSTARGHLSVSTDYPSSTPPSSGGSSSNATSGEKRDGHTVANGDSSPSASSGEGANVQIYVHDERRIQARDHAEPMIHTNGRAATSVMVASNVVAHSLRCIPEERDHAKSAGNSPSAIQPRPGHQINSRPVYASVEKKNKLYQSDSPLASTSALSGHAHRSKTNTMMSQVRSISEIYSAPAQPGDFDDNDADTASISTLEGKRYSPTQEQIREATIVRADVHHLGSPTSPTPPPMRSPPSRSPPPIPNDAPPVTQKTVTQSRDEDWQIYVLSLEGDRSQILTDRDIDRWRALLTNDVELRQKLVNCKTAEDFECVSQSSRYAREFSKEKWAVIVQNLSQVAFMRRLTNIIDNQHEKQMQKSNPILPAKATGQVQPILVKPLDPAQLNSSYDMGETLRNLQQGKQKRLFTRESYHQVKQGVTPISINLDGKSTDKTDQPSSTTTTVSNAFRDRSNSECFEMPPMLTVYLGDVSSDRNLYADNFMGPSENEYSVGSRVEASERSLTKAYQYESDTRADEHHYQVGTLINANSEMESNASKIYAPPSSSTIYGPEIGGTFKQF